MSWQRIGGISGVVVSILTILGLLVVGGGQYLEWRVSVKVDKALAEMDIGTDAKIVDMDKNIATNTSDIAHNRDSNDRTQRQLEEVARILMQPPE